MANEADLLAAFSHPTRQAIIELLRKRPFTVGELATHLPVTRPAVSQHLQALKAAGLVTEQRSGTRHHFRLEPKSLAELRTHIDAMWRDALAAFSDFAQKEKTGDGKHRKRTGTGEAKRAGRLRA
jgi:DNA-binding transcriptional ArsR family regulator